MENRLVSEIIDLCQQEFNIREAGPLPPSSSEVKEWLELYLHSPNTPSWRGAQFQKKSTGTTLPLPLPRIEPQDRWSMQNVKNNKPVYIVKEPW
jgi:hypothetical protein